MVGHGIALALGQGLPQPAQYLAGANKRVGQVVTHHIPISFHAPREGSEAPMHALAHRLQGLEAIGRPGCMNANDFRIGVFHGVFLRGR